MNRFQKALVLAEKVEAVYVRPNHAKTMAALHGEVKRAAQYRHDSLAAIKSKLWLLMVGIGQYGPHTHEFDQAALATCVWYWEELRDTEYDQDVDIAIEELYNDIVLTDESHPLLGVANAMALPEEVVWIDRFLKDHPQFNNDDAEELFGVINDQSKMRWHLTRQLNSFCTQYRSLNLQEYSPFHKDRLTIVSQGLDYPGDQPIGEYQQDVLDNFRERLSDMVYKPNWGDLKYIPNAAPGVDLLRLSKVELAFKALNPKG